MFIGFLGLMNSDRPIDSDRRPFRFYLFGTRQEILSAINQLHALRFSDRIRWTPPMPVPGSDWQYVSLMERDRRDPPLYLKSSGRPIPPGLRKSRASQGRHYFALGPTPRIIGRE